MILAVLPELILTQTGPVAGRSATLSSRERPRKVRWPFHPTRSEVVAA